MRCPHCGGEIEVQQVRAVRARWKRERERREEEVRAEARREDVSEVAEEREAHAPSGPLPVRCRACRCEGGVKTRYCLRVGQCGCHRGA